MAAYAIDLRQKLIQAYERRLGSQRGLADVCGVRLSVVEKVWRRSRTTGELGPTPHAGGQRPQVDAAAQARIRPRVHEAPEVTLAELCARLADITGIRVRVATRCRMGQRFA